MKHSWVKMDLVLVSGTKRMLPNITRIDILWRCACVCHVERMGNTQCVKYEEKMYFWKIHFYNGILLKCKLTRHGERVWTVFVLLRSNAIFGAVRFLNLFTRKLQ
jgi:hypothetical protein